MKRLIQIVLVAALAFAAPVHAVKHYSCDFEIDSVRNRWVLTPTANSDISALIRNRWYIGAPGNNSRTGQYGLYISDDGGQTAHYTNEAGCWVFAYDTISLDPLVGKDYTIYFDYTVMANVASSFDGLYLLWIPMTKANGTPIKVLSIPSSSNTVPSQYQDYTIVLQKGANIEYLNGTSTWRQCAATIPGAECDGTPHYLAFAWANGSFVPQQPGAMIDNITITDNSPCPAPTDLIVTPNGTTVMLEWTGDSTAEYEVSAYSYDGDMWLGPKIVTGTQTSFTGLPMGQADFIVRTKCDVDFFSLKTIESKLIYYPDQLCVDYLNLNNAVCYTATTSSSADLRMFNNFDKVNKPVDYGPGSKESQHVVHFDRTELEPRTGNHAKTVPDGELASVRLGNWESGYGAERIEFSFAVDTIKYPVLLLKYMPILEAPGHGVADDPRFKLDILINGNSIGECGQADFNCNDVYKNGQLLPGAENQGWHVEPSGNGFSEIVWKEWTTVGVNLRDKGYAGKTLTARLTTFDCTWGGHCGYAYFTLGCSDGKLKGMKCGEINPDFEAPDGFNYRWIKAEDEKYRKPDGSIDERYVKWRTQKVTAGYHDDTLYVVDCMFVQDSSCYFSLYASALATNPISVIGKPRIQKNCAEGKYSVRFDGSRSWVQEIDHVTGDTLRDKNYHIETYEWNIEGIPYGWSDQAVATFDFPVEGGDFPYSLRTTCGTCESVKHDTLHLAPLGPTYETRTYTLCDDERKGAGYIWDENIKLKKDTAYHTYGLVDSVVLYNEQSSCDSIIYLELMEPIRIFVDTMLLPEDLPTFEFHGKTYGPDTKSMIDTVPSALLCGLTWVLNLEIYESLIVYTPVTAYTWCEGEEDSLTLVWDIKRGRSQAVYTHFGNNPADTIYNSEKPKAHYEEKIYVGNLQPNVYKGTLHLVDLKPEFSVKVDYTLTVNYSSSVIAQRWNDVLAIRNDSSIKVLIGDNGYDYHFDSVQWYLNGQPIEGATDFNYYTGKDTQLRMGERYAALLTRNDGVKLFTCDFIPAPVATTDVPDMPSLVPPGAPLPVKGKGTALWYDILGRTTRSEAYNASEITAPTTPGYYILVLQTSTGRSIHRIMIR